MTQRRAWLVVFLLCIAIITAGLVYYRHISSTRTLRVVFENAKDVRIVDISEEQEGGKEKQIALIKNSGDTVRVRKDVSVFVRYTGAIGYADGFENGSTATVTIKPEYSAERIKEIIRQQQSDIQSAIFQNIRNGLSYSLDEGSLFDHGTWYISTLKPSPSTENEADTLRVLLKKDGNVWTMMGSPKLVFTKYNTKDVPVAVLDAVNTYSPN